MEKSKPVEGAKAAKAEGSVDYNRMEIILSGMALLISEETNGLSKEKPGSIEMEHAVERLKNLEKARQSLRIEFSNTKILDKQIAELEAKKAQLMEKLEANNKNLNRHADCLQTFLKDVIGNF